MTVEWFETEEYNRPILVVGFEGWFDVAEAATGALTWLADMHGGAGELFAIARTAGWIAHALEEFTEPPLRFRVEARPTAPRPVLPED